MPTVDAIDIEGLDVPVEDMKSFLQLIKKAG